MCTIGCSGAWLLVHRRRQKDVSRLGHLSASIEMPLHLLPFREKGEFSHWVRTAVNKGNAVLRQDQWARYPACVPVALHGKHDQWLFLKDLDFR